MAFSPLCSSNHFMESLILIIVGVTLQNCNCHGFSYAGIITCAVIVFTVLLNITFSLFVYSHSDSPHSEPGTIDEADNCTEPHTSDDGTGILAFIHCFIHTLIIVSYGRMLYSVLLYKRPQITRSRNQHLRFLVYLVNRSTVRCLC